MKRLLSLCVVALTPLAVWAGDLGTSHCGEFGCPRCGSCGRCVMKVEPTTEEDVCYDLECKEVCIPPVRFPWESCRTPKYGRVRVVTRFKEQKREKPACEYKWAVLCDRCGRPVALEKDDASKTSKGTAKPDAKAASSTVPPLPPPLSPSPEPTRSGERGEADAIRAKRPSS